MVIRDPAFGRYRIEWNYNGGTVLEDGPHGKTITRLTNQALGACLGEITRRLIAEIEGDVTLLEFKEKTQAIQDAIVKAGELVEEAVATEMSQAEIGEKL